MGWQRTAAVAGAAVVFTVGVLCMQDSLRRFGANAVLVWHGDQELAHSLGLFSFFGKGSVLTMLVAAVMFGHGYLLGVRLLSLAGAASVVVALLKLLLHQPRPSWLENGGSVCDPEFAMPSGHAVLSTAIFVAISAQVMHPWLRRKTGMSSGLTTILLSVAVALVLVPIGLSRVAKGAHLPDQVAVGWAVGAAMATGYLDFQRQIEGVCDWLSTQSINSAAVIGIAVWGGVIIVAEIAKLILMAAWEIPQEWETNRQSYCNGEGTESAYAASVNTAVLSAVELAAVPVLLAIQTRQYPMEYGDSVAKAVARVVLIVALLVAVDQLCNATFPTHHIDDQEKAALRAFLLELVKGGLIAGALLLGVVLCKPMQLVRADASLL